MKSFPKILDGNIAGYPSSFVSSFPVWGDHNLQLAWDSYQAHKPAFWHSEENKPPFPLNSAAVKTSSQLVTLLMKHLDHWHNMMRLVKTQSVPSPKPKPRKEHSTVCPKKQWAETRWDGEAGKVGKKRVVGAWQKQWFWERGDSQKGTGKGVGLLVGPQVFGTAVLEKTLESPLNCKEIKSINPQGNQPQIFTGRTDAEAEAPILWPPNPKSQFIWNDPDAGKDWRQKKGWQGMRWLDSITDSMGMNLSKLLKIVEDRGAWHAAVLGVAKSQTRLGYLTPPPPRVWIRGGEYPSISKGLLFQVGTELAEQFLFKWTGQV